VATRLPSSDPHSWLGTLERCYQEYRAELRRFIKLRARRNTNIDDLGQEIYERLLKYRPSEPVKDLQAYIFQTARYVIWSANRRSRVAEQRYVTAEAAELEEYAGGSRSLWVQEYGGEELAQDEIWRVLEQLPPKVRIALLRTRRDGWTYQQVAAELGLAVNTIKCYLTQAHKHFDNHFSVPRRAARRRRTPP
jgi:RNA polymerase sigma-19 factor, ECF subfamily